MISVCIACAWWSSFGEPSARQEKVNRCWSPISPHKTSRSFFFCLNIVYEIMIFCKGTINLVLELSIGDKCSIVMGGGGGPYINFYSIQKNMHIETHTHSSKHMHQEKRIIVSQSTLKNSLKQLNFFNCIWKLCSLQIWVLPAYTCETKYMATRVLHLCLDGRKFCCPCEDLSCSVGRFRLKG